MFDDIMDAIATGRMVLSRGGVFKSDGPSIRFHVLFILAPSFPAASSLGASHARAGSKRTRTLVVVVVLLPLPPIRLAGLLLPLPPLRLARLRGLSGVSLSC